MSPDPVITEIGDSQRGNPYSYVENRPLTLTDPTGFDGEGLVKPIDPCSADGQCETVTVGSGPQDGPPASGSYAGANLQVQTGSAGTTTEASGGGMQEVVVTAHKPVRPSFTFTLVLRPVAPLDPQSVGLESGLEAKIYAAVGLCPNGRPPSKVNNPNVGNNMKTTAAVLGLVTTTTVTIVGILNLEDGGGELIFGARLAATTGRGYAGEGFGNLLARLAGFAEPSRNGLYAGAYMATAGMGTGLAISAATCGK